MLLFVFCTILDSILFAFYFPLGIHPLTDLVGKSEKQKKKQLSQAIVDAVTSVLTMAKGLWPLRWRRSAPDKPCRHRCRRSITTSPLAAARRRCAYIGELLPDVLKGRIEPGRVFDRVSNLDGVPQGYRDMNDRNAIKVMIKP